MNLGAAMRIETVENTVKKLESIVTCKIIEGQDSILSEIHVVSNGKRSAKQLVRDIQSLIIATYNIPVDHKTISIAEIPEYKLKANKNRIKIISVSHDNTGDRATIRIVLERNDEIFENSSRGINAGRNIDRMLVDTTLKTVEQACGYQETFVLEDIKSVNFSTANSIVVIIGVYNGTEQRFCGSSLVGQDYKQSVVKATLDAINRYLLK